MSNANPNSNNTVLIRQLSSVDAADVADYRAIRLAALKDSPDAFGSTYEAEVGLSTEAFAERLATTIVLGAYAGTGSDARIVGMVGFKQQTIAKLAHKGFVWGFYVAPAARGRGVGVALVERIVAAATGSSSNSRCRWYAATMQRWHCTSVAGLRPTAWSRARLNPPRAMQTKC